MIGCNKDTTSLENLSDNPVSYRSDDGIDINWLIDFQTYLRDLRDNTSTGTITSYTDEDAEYGLEILFNLKYSRYFADENTSFLRDSFTYNSLNETYYDLYEKMETAFEANTTLNDKTVGVSIMFDRVEGDTSYFYSTMILSGGSDCNIYDDCDYFDSSESYYFGVGEIWPDTPSVGLDCFNQEEIEVDLCGGLDANNQMVTTALTEVQNKLNCFNENDYCTGPGYSNADFVKFLQIKYHRFEENLWIPFNRSPYTGDQCGSPKVLSNGFKPCDCLSANELNSLVQVFGQFFEDEIYELGGNDYRLVSANIGTDVAGNPYSYTHPLRAEIYYGVPYCINVLELDPLIVGIEGILN